MTNTLAPNLARVNVYDNVQKVMPLTQKEWLIFLHNSVIDLLKELEKICAKRWYNPSERKKIKGLLDKHRKRRIDLWKGDKEIRSHETFVQISKCLKLAKKQIRLLSPLPIQKAKLKSNKRQNLRRPFDAIEIPKPIKSGFSELTK